MTTPLVSIVIPFFNAHATLADVVRSVFAQTYGNWELILLDDGSTDGSLELARRIRDPRIRVESDGSNRGLVFRLNQMPALTRGEFIARMDADDLMHPERLAKQVQWFQDHPETEVLATGAVSLAAGWRAIAVRDVDALDMTPRGVFRRGGILHPSVMARRAWFAANPYDPGYPRAEDRELWLRSLGHTRFRKIPEPLCFYTEMNVVQLPKYLASYRSERRAIRTHGPALVGLPQTLLLLARSWAKSVILRLLGALGLQNTIVRRRLNGGDRDLRDVQRMIDAILALRLPGLDD